MSELPPEVRTLEPHEAEDFLCIYKDQLAGKPGSRRGCCKPSPPMRDGETPCTW